MVANRRKSLPAFDYWEDEMSLLTEIKTCPANTILLSVRMGWDNDRINGCLERLQSKGKIYKSEGKWYNRIEQLQIPLEQPSKISTEQLENIPLEQTWKVGDRIAHIKFPSQAGTVVKILDSRVKISWDAGGESYIESHNLKTAPPKPKELKRARKGFGSGYVYMRAVNVKRNEAKGKPPDYCYYWHYSYTDYAGKEIKKTVYLKLSQVDSVKRMIESKVGYKEILRWLKK